MRFFSTITEGDIGIFSVQVFFDTLRANRRPFHRVDTDINTVSIVAVAVVEGGLVG
jgi:hypothetical protein